MPSFSLKTTLILRDAKTVMSPMDGTKILRIYAIEDVSKKMNSASLTKIAAMA